MIKPQRKISRPFLAAGANQALVDEAHALSGLDKVAIAMATHKTNDLMGGHSNDYRVRTAMRGKAEDAVSEREIVDVSTLLNFKTALRRAINDENRTAVHHLGAFMESHLKKYPAIYERVLKDAAILAVSKHNSSKVFRTLLESAKPEGSILGEIEKIAEKSVGQQTKTGLYNVRTLVAFYKAHLNTPAQTPSPTP